MNIIFLVLGTDFSVFCESGNSYFFVVVVAAQVWYTQKQILTGKVFLELCGWSGFVCMCVYTQMGNGLYMGWVEHLIVSVYGQFLFMVSIGCCYLETGIFYWYIVNLVCCFLKLAFPWAHFQGTEVEKKCALSPCDITKIYVMIQN